MTTNNLIATRDTPAQLRQIAERHAAENRSDPFAYNRCLSRLMHGWRHGWNGNICQSDDYNERKVPCT